MLLRAYPDPNTETTTVDGRVGRSGSSETFSTIRTSAGTFATDDAAANTCVQLLADTVSNRYDVMVKGVTLFDTSSIPDTDELGDAILAVNLDFVSDGLDAGNGKVVVVQPSPASNTALATSDYNNANWATTELATAKTFASMGTTNYEEFTLNASGLAIIDKTGVTKLGYTTNWDNDNSAPAWSSADVSQIGLNWADQTGTSTDPLLIVSHGAGQVVDTFYPDPDPETTTVDGVVGRISKDESWATIRSSAGDQANDTGAGAVGPHAVIRVSTSNASNWRNMQRGIILFDTSAITTGATIDEATMGVIVSGKTDTLTPSSGTMGVRCIDTTPASNTTLATSDYGNTGTTAQAPDVDMSGLTLDTLHQFVLNATGRGNISDTGVTKLGTAQHRDADNNEPTGSHSLGDQANITFYSADDTGTDKDPTLVVAYSTGTTVSPSAQVATFSLPAETVTGEASIAVNAQTITSSLPAITITADWTVNVNAQTITATVPAYIVSAGGVIIPANVSTLTFTLPAESIEAGAVLSPNGQTLTFTVPAAAITADWTVPASVQSLTVSVPTLAFIGAVWSRLGRNSTGDWTRSARNDDY